MLAPELALVVLNQIEPLGLFSSAVFQVGLEVCAACKSWTPLKVPAVIPNEASTPVPSSTSTVLLPADESPNAPPLWKISRLPVIVFTLDVIPGTLALFIAVLTSDNAVPPVVIVVPFITKV